MIINRQTSLFFDASVLVAGSHSPSGGSALILAACRAGGFRPQITTAVVLESFRALKGFSQESLERFQQPLEEIAWELLPVPSAEVIQHYGKYIDPKDAHVLAAAVEGRSEFLLTLDRRHILAAVEPVQIAGFPITILRPRDFIRQYYPQHEDYACLPAPRE